jgi:hypothetical protein
MEPSALTQTLKAPPLHAKKSQALGMTKGRLVAWLGFSCHKGKTADPSASLGTTILWSAERTVFPRGVGRSVSRQVRWRVEQTAGPSASSGFPVGLSDVVKPRAALLRESRIRVRWLVQRVGNPEFARNDKFVERINNSPCQGSGQYFPVEFLMAITITVCTDRKRSFSFSRF